MNKTETGNWENYKIKKKHEQSKTYHANEKSLAELVVSVLKNGLWETWIL